MQNDYKFHLNYKADIYVGKKLVTIAPRGTIKLTKDDIKSSPQIQELLARSALRLLPSKKENSGTPSAKHSSETKDEPKG